MHSISRPTSAVGVSLHSTLYCGTPDFASKAIPDPLHTASADVAEHYSRLPGQSFGERCAQASGTVEAKENKRLYPKLQSL